MINKNEIRKNEVNNMLEGKDVIFYDFDGTLLYTDSLFFETTVSTIKKISKEEVDEAAIYDMLMNNVGVCSFTKFINDNFSSSCLFTESSVAKEVAKIRAEIYLNLCKSGELKLFEPMREIFFNNIDKKNIILSYQDEEVIRSVLGNYDMLEHIDHIYSLASKECHKKHFLDALKDEYKGSKDKLVFFEDDFIFITELMAKGYDSIFIDNVCGTKEIDYTEINIYNV